MDEINMIKAIYSDGQVDFFTEVCHGRDVNVPKWTLEGGYKQYAIDLAKMADIQNKPEEVIVYMPKECTDIAEDCEMIKVQLLCTTEGQYEVLKIGYTKL